ncbi:MAG: aminopeptidase [Candidatus Eiseniibacteriota bacterium]|nr:MAG: aminopeptidase [Candidatus Eisenbacteria bacterium]
MDRQLLRAARVALKDCMKVSRKETLLVVTDERLRKIGYGFWTVGKQMGFDSIITEFVEREVHGAEPPPAVAKLMADVDVIIAPTYRSLSHTNARRNACSRGARVATLPGITADSMRRTLIVDYKKMRKLTLELTALLTRASVAHLTTPAGTDITMSLRGRKGLADTGVAHKRGEFTNLPAGEAYIAPVEGTANGVIVVDGSMSGVGLTRTPVTMRVEKGRVIKFEGGKNAATIRGFVRKVGKLATNVAELGIGTNRKARVTGNTLEDEKAIGTVHMAIGDNRSMGGKVDIPLHLDAVMLKPTLTLDGKLVLKNGKLLK